MLSTKGQRLVESASKMTGQARRLLDDKLEEVGEKLGRKEQRLAEVERRLALLQQAEVEVGWVVTCLKHFDKVWETLTAQNRALPAPDIQVAVLGLESVDGVEPISERALRGVAHAGAWAKQRAVWGSLTKELSCQVGHARATHRGGSDAWTASAG